MQEKLSNAQLDKLGLEQKVNECVRVCELPHQP